MPDDINVSIVSKGEPIAGENYSLTCYAELPEGLSVPPALKWSDVNGDVESGEEITVEETVLSSTNFSLSLEFKPLRLLHVGKFICQAMISTPSLPYTLEKYAEIDITTDSKCCRIQTCYH